MQPQLEIGLPFKPMSVGEGWQDWPSLPDLFPTSFPGVKTSRDSFLIDVDLDRLKERVGDYFNSELSHEEIARRYPSVMNSSARFNSRAVRDSLLKRDKPDEKSDFVRHSYRPFDNRWLYWEAETKLLDEKTRRLQAPCNRWKHLVGCATEAASRMVVTTSYCQHRMPGPHG